MSEYGRIIDKGQEVEEATVSILTGRKIAKNGSVSERIAGTDYFYRFESRYAYRVTDELRKEWRANAPKSEKKTFARKPKQEVKEQDHE